MSNFIFKIVDLTEHGIYLAKIDILFYFRNNLEKTSELITTLNEEENMLELDETSYPNLQGLLQKLNYG